MRKAPTAQIAVALAVGRLVERARAAAYRVVCAHPDPEAVHDFRVALRRLRTVVHALRPLFGKKKVKPIDDALRRFTEATSALRDAEVLRDTLALADLDHAGRRAADRWLTERRAHEETLRQTAVDLVRGPDLEAVFADLFALVAAAPKRDEPLASFAEARIAEAQEAIGELLPVTPGDVARLHRLRIRFKRLRYVAEMLTDLAGPRSDKRLRARLARSTRESAHMQTLLGELHDADQALATLDSTELAPVEQDALRGVLVALRERLAIRALEGLAAVPHDVVPASERVREAPETPNNRKQRAQER